MREEIATKLHDDELEVALCAFPFKIRNPLKTIDDRIDWGERVALQRLVDISAGAAELEVRLHWRIITDGRFYCDELATPAEVARQYARQVADVAGSLGLDARFVELDDLVPGKPRSARPLSSADPAQRPYVVRTAGMLDTREHAAFLWDAYRQAGHVGSAMESLLDADASFRAQAEHAAGLYQARKRHVEGCDLFEEHFPDAVRASIQPDVNRNLRGEAIARPLSVRISESRRKNLFPWLGIGCKDKAWHNMYIADATDHAIHVEEGLRFIA